jgi:hypothetical protein
VLSADSEVGIITPKVGHQTDDFRGLPQSFQESVGMAWESHQRKMYKYYIYGRYPLSCLYKKKSPVYFSKQRFGDWILSLSSGKTYSVEPNRLLF